MEVIRRFLEPRLHENFVATVEARIPWLVRSGAAGLDTLVGHEFVTLRRHGKFLLFATDDDRLLVVNPMLTGRFHWAEPTERRRPMTALVLGFADGHQLRYFGARRMGRWYLVPTADLASVPQFAELGPDAMTVGEDELVVRLKRHPGQIKSTLTNQKFIAGIGNAYSDEILWEAGLHPHRRLATMDEADLRRLFAAMRAPRLRGRCPSSRPRCPSASTRATRSGVTTSGSTARRISHARAAVSRSTRRCAGAARQTIACTASRSRSADRARCGRLGCACFEGGRDEDHR